MKQSKDIFHLAIPSKDLSSSKKFYESQLGCRVAREYADRITLDFFGMQVVCHLSPERYDREPRMYPRHFGLTLHDLDNFNSIYRRARDNEIPFFKERFKRFEGKPEEHESFFLTDPSNNLIEFKHYANEEMMF